MAMACLRLFTLLRPPDFSLPCLYSLITLPTLFCALLEYLRPELLDDVLLDFSIPPAFPPTAQKILRDTPLNYIVLRPPLDICAARARDRAEGKIAKYDRGFYAAFAAEERHAVAPDDSESPKAIADVIFKGLAEGHFRVGPDAIAPL